MKKRVLSIIFTGIIVSSTFLGGCSTKESNVSKSDVSKFNVTGLPIVKQKVTLKVVSPKAPLAPSYNEMTIFKKLEEQTNVHIDWNNIPDTDYQEKKNLLLASGDLPDAFYNAGFSDYDLVKYSQDGTIIPLDDLIDKYMPNVKKLLEKKPEIKKFITSPDGKIYSLPIGEEMGSGQGAIGSNPYFFFINKKWLDKLGMKIPTTLDELHDVLVAFKEKDPNGNGKKDENPMSFIHMWWCADIGNLFGGFGMADPNDHLIVRDGKVIYTAVREEYKEAIQYFSKWVQEGLIDKESFTLTKDPNALFAKGKTSEQTLGSFIWWEETEIVGPEREKDYVLVGPLKGPKGEQKIAWSNGSQWGRGAFVITKANKNPEITARWIDQQFEPKMTAQIHWGPIGEVYEEKDGKLVNKPLPEGVAMGEFRQKVAPNGAGVVTAEDFEKIVDMEPRAKVRIDRVKLFTPYMEKEHLPSLFYTPEEVERRNQIETELGEYVNKKRAQWLMNGGIEGEWDKYLSDLKKIGIDEYIKITQAAYDRYNSNK
ncbi:ABC transporter substrate-binding protein [Clostridium sp. SYSU_GA19001]|uniref:ABC transporter substrate-binding protein n=1 Tax=Clostridium caldaquaticum TaxID=2940653 RepID=UPI002076E524|nr:ABC transporter substrate-binding protein [Clostridium caldaquaticum]MCM8711215.1 ABC transporter substrate-binding protein [Clostridium caldaquaticum]